MLLDPDSILTQEIPDGALPQRTAAAGPHPNDVLAYSPEREKPDLDTVSRMLECIAIPDAAGQRRGPWLKVLQGVHDCFGGSEEAFRVVAAWSSTQPGYVDDADVRATWDSCRGKGVTIASVIQLALDGGFTFEPPAEEDAVDGVPETLAAQLPADVREILGLDGGAQSLLARINSYVDGGENKSIAALRELEADLIYVADQQAYFSRAHRTLLNQFGIKQQYRSAMPRSTAGPRLDPCRLLENSSTKKVVSSMGYHPGEGEVFLEHGRWIANWHEPWEIEPLAPTPAETELFRELLIHIAPRRSDWTFMTYLMKMLAYVVQNPGAKVASAPLLYSPEQGTGKTTMLYEVPKLLVGPHNSQLVLNAEMESAFSDFLARTHFIHLDEIFMGGMKQAAAAADKFKPIVTNSTIRVHPKGFAGYDLTNRLLVTACSNRENALHMSDYDRRWAVHEVRAGKMDKSFARTLYAFLWGPRGAGVLRHMFLNTSTAGFNPYADAPMTQEKKAMINASLGFEESLLRQAVADYLPPFEKDLFSMDEAVTWLDTKSGRKMSPAWAERSVKVALPNARLVYRVKWGKSIVRLWTCRNHKHWMTAELKDVAEYMEYPGMTLAPEIVEEEQAA